LKNIEPRVSEIITSFEEIDNLPDQETSVMLMKKLIVKNKLSWERKLTVVMTDKSVKEMKLEENWKFQKIIEVKRLLETQNLSWKEIEVELDMDEKDLEVWV
jgi:hypothetical protein